MGQALQCLLCKCEDRGHPQQLKLQRVPGVPVPGGRGRRVPRAWCSARLAESVRDLQK